MCRYGLVASVIHDNVLRNGAKVYLLNWHGYLDSIETRGISKKGRRITKYVAVKRICNIRAAWLPDHIFDRAIKRYETKEEAEQAARSLSKFIAGEK